MEWTVEFHAEFAVEFGDLHEDVQDELAAHVELLKVAGPRLGRPRADTLAGSAHANMKELPFNTADGVWRMRSTRTDEPSFWWPATSRAARRGVSTRV